MPIECTQKEVELGVALVKRAKYLSAMLAEAKKTKPKLQRPSGYRRMQEELRVYNRLAKQAGWDTF